MMSIQLEQQYKLGYLKDRMLFSQNLGYSNSRKQLPKEYINPLSSFSNLNNLNNNNNNNNNKDINKDINNNSNLSSPPSITPMSKLSKKKSSTINSNKSQLNLNSINSKSNLNSINTNTNTNMNINSINSKSSLPSNNNNSTTNRQSSKVSNNPTNRRSAIQSNKQLQQFQFIHRVFSNLFTSAYLSFNQLIYALKSIGIEIDSQRRFIQIKSIFDQLKVKNQPIIEYQQCIKVGIKLLREEKNKPTSDVTHLQKAYYHMVQQGNQLQIPLSQSLNTLSQFKSFINSNYPQQQKRYITRQSVLNIVQYLGMESQLPVQIIQEIFTYADQQDKGYLSFQDILTAIQASQILNK